MRMRTLQVVEALPLYIITTPSVSNPDSIAHYDRKDRPKPSLHSLLFSQYVVLVHGMPPFGRRLIFLRLHHLPQQRLNKAII